MSRWNITYYFTLLCSVLSLQCISQKIDYDITVVGEADRMVEDANKISENAAIFTPEVAKPKIVYYNLPRQVKTGFDVLPIIAPKLKVVEPLEQLYNGYARAGIGMYATPYAEIYYNATRSRTENWGIHLKHLSSKGGIQDLGPSNFSNNKVDLMGKKFLKNFEVGANLQYKRDAIRYYGYKPELFPNLKNNTSHIYNLLEAKTNLQSFFKDSADLNYKLKLNYYHLSDNLNASENNVALITSFRKFMDNELLLLDVGLDINNYQYPFTDLSGMEHIHSINNGIVKIAPKISSRGENWKADAGLRIEADADNTAHFHFYPDVVFNYSMLNDIFIPYAGLTGGIERNSFRTLSDENPFIKSDVEMQNTNNKFEIYGGIRGTLSSDMAFNLKVSNRKLEGLPDFVNNPYYDVIDSGYRQNTFIVEYDTVNILTLRGELSYEKSERLDIYAKAAYFIYNTDDTYPWDLPDWQFDLSASYTMWKKFIVKTNVVAKGRRKVKSLVPLNTDGELIDGVYAIDLPVYADINLGFEYRYTKRLSAFINFNNIGNSKYLRWYKYPVQGINILGGATYTF